MHIPAGVTFGDYQTAASQAAPVVKNLPANAGDTRDGGSIPAW